mgnify:CR=1 FL=1
MEADPRSVQILCERALAGEELSRDEVVKLLGLKDLRNLEILRQAAEEGLRRWVGPAVDIMYTLSISSFCAHNCLYCDFRASNSSLERFRLTSEQIISSIRPLTDNPHGTIVLDGAQDPNLDLEFIEPILEALRDNRPPVLSLGERKKDYYEKLRSYGVQRYILEHKTASPILYNELHPERDYFDRLQSIRTLLGLGFNVGTSVTVGLPQQDLWDLTDDFLQIRDLGLDTIIVGPFIPGTKSPLSESPRGTIQASLNAIAVARLVLKDARIPGGLAMSMLDSGSGVEALRWGADCIICDVVHQPNEGKSCSVSPMCDSITTRIRSLGRRLAKTERMAHN